MNRIRTIFIATVVAGLLAPAATAAWSSYGDLEPNTAHDSSAYMFADADASKDGQRIYFNAFPAAGLGLITANPSTAVGGARVSPTPTLSWAAVLGIWKDCNGDGYMGNAAGAAMEYRSELLVASVPGESVCPPLMSPHNDGSWVTEVLTIGMVDPCEYATDETKENATHPCSGAGDFIPRPGVIYVNGTKLWTDRGQPGAVHNGLSSCPIRPHDRGTFSNTGMMLRVADCLVAWRIANTVNIVDSDGSLGLRFEDPRNPHKSSSLLNQNLPVSVFGNPNDGRVGLLEQDSRQYGHKRPTATVWECSNGEGTLDVKTAEDPTNASLFSAADYALDGVTIGAAEGKAAVQTYNTQVRPVLNQIVNENGINDNPNYFGNITVAWNDCDAESQNELGATYYGENLYGQDPGSTGWLEGTNSPTPLHKTENELTWTFFDGGYDPRDADNKIILDNLGKSTPVDFGIAATHGTYGPLWGGYGNYVATPQSISRATLGPAAADYWTTYAFVNYLDDNFPSGVAFPSPPNTPFTYGAEQCGSNRDEIRGGWACDPSVWFKDSNGVSTRQYYSDEVTPLGATIGEPYHLRDVDCFDGTLVAGQPVRAALTDLHRDGPCDASARYPAVVEQQLDTVRQTLSPFYG